MHLALAILLQVTSLLASAGDSTKAKDALIQQAVLKQKIALQLNETTGLE